MGNCDIVTADSPDNNALIFPATIHIRITVISNREDMRWFLPKFFVSVLFYHII